MLGTEPPGYSVAWSMHVGVVCNSHISVCVPHGALFQNGERDQDGFVAILCDIIMYDMVASRAMRVIRNVCSVLLFCLGLGWYLCKFISSCTQFGGRNRGR